MATQAAIRSASLINDVADMPYDMVRPILLRIQSPQQLQEIEVNCPHIAERSEELWKAFIARDIPDWEKKIVTPKKPTSWHKVYQHLMRREERKRAEDEEALRKAYQGETMKKSNNEAVFVKKVLPHARSETETNMFVDGVARRDQKKAPTLKNAKTGKDALAAIRRQTAQASKMKAMGRPLQGPSQSQTLATAKRQIAEAPRAMIEATVNANAQKPLTIAPRELLPHEKSMMQDYQRSMANVRVQPPARRSNMETARRNQTVIKAAAQEARAANEAKLRALATQHKRSSAQQHNNGKKFEFAPPPAVTEVARSASPTSAKESKGSVTGPAAHISSKPASTALPPPPPLENAPSPGRIIKKRPAQTNIFMTNTTKKRKG